MKRLTLVLLLVLTAPAQAGTIELRTYKERWYYVFTAAPGERNQITMELTARKTFRFTDTGAPTTGDCTPDGPHAVVCPEARGLTIHAGDGDDVVVDRSGWLDEADGGPGNDRLEGQHLRGGEGDDLLTGTRFEDTLAGGRGRDVLSGGAGDDGLDVSDEGEADAVDGGPGRDRAAYSGRERDARIDLARDRGPDGDVLTGIEDAAGGDGDDVLIGDARPNALDGGRGDDRVEGRGGDDTIDSSSGIDDLRGGPGDDRLKAHRTAEVRCGPGRDRVSAFIGVPRLRADCEHAKGAGPVLRFGRGTVNPIWDGKAFPKPCRLRITFDGVPLTPGRTVAIRRPATLRFSPGGQCGPKWLDPLDPASFRLL